ncbi:hypothetical protein GCM10007320_65360 [Pseudorhodoferax aquiterrae]|uniref:Uncharacterized protein n=1 Tax=Pseudorhodoferax aquiterrae TaxID=747304 RepID=A0ABQ3GFG5_9BURK|nr:hypothetical protein GCM10007320_65360 [Pseudorhodoferax aquiterrae]
MPDQRRVGKLGAGYEPIAAIVAAVRLATRQHRRAQRDAQAAKTADRWLLLSSISDTLDSAIVIFAPISDIGGPLTHSPKAAAARSS